MVIYLVKLEELFKRELINMVVICYAGKYKQRPAFARIWKCFYNGFTVKSMKQKQVCVSLTPVCGWMCDLSVCG